MENAVLTFDGPADEQGRRSFTITWVDPKGVFRQDLGRDGEPVGFRRGQCFRANPTAYVEQIRACGGQIVEG